MKGVGMFSDLRSKLIAAFVSVILLSLLLASAAFVFLLRGYQTQLKLRQLEDIAVPMSYQAQLLERAGASPEQIGLFLQDQTKDLNVRILLLDPEGIVAEDSQGELRGQRVILPSNPPTAGRLAYSLSYDGSENLFLVVTRVRPTTPFGERFFSRAPTYTVALAVPQQSVASSWLELAPNLSLAALISLIASITLAVLLSRSISQPISAVTKASEEMARGNYDQSITVKSGDEIGRMAMAFNAMAAQVKSSHRTLRDFLANVSHELKTPLTSIQGFSQAMVDGAIQDASGYADAGRIINEETERMRRLVDDLLYLSKIESGQIPMEKLPVDLESLVAACVGKVDIQARQANISIGVQVSGLPLIRGDAHKLEQVFINLLDNALKHTPGGGAITITGAVAPARRSADLGDDRHSLACIAVHNTGSRIPSEELDKVFERFYQVDKSRARSSAGTGLGLSIVKEIVQAHGGSVEARSESLNGTEFVVHLPTIS
ncbi:MAG: HAMP domain-containing protein [Chloroflexi bacterium]|nr:HAMP domain-containing protein [Chloroflexota bacterium]